VSVTTIGTETKQSTQQRHLMCDKKPISGQLYKRHATRNKNKTEQNKTYKT